MTVETNDQSGEPVLYTVRLANGETFGPADRDVLVQWARESRIPHQAMIESSDGERVSADSLPWIVEARVRSVPPRSPEGLATGERAPNAIDHVIPLRNVPALFAWYLGVFSLIPFLGIPLGIAAVILGVIGLLKARQSSVKVGFWHSVLGILLGLFGGLGLPMLLIIVLS